MNKKFEQISIKSSFMKHNGGLLFRELSKNQFEFKTKIKKTHLNTAEITHGGYISYIIDSGAGTAAFRASKSSRCVTISLNINFIASTKLDDEIIGFVKVLKKTKTLVFISSEIFASEKIVATTSGTWKIL